MEGLEGMEMASGPRDVEQNNGESVVFLPFLLLSDFFHSFASQVTFDIDANGILNVSAVEKSTNKENKITITNDKGRLSKEDIERMVNEAERYHAEDQSQKERVAAKNNLESYCFNVKNSIEDENIKAKIAEGDRKLIADKCDEIIKWLDINTSATKEQFENKLKDAEKVCFFLNIFLFHILYYICGGRHVFLLFSFLNNEFNRRYCNRIVLRI